MQHIRFLEPDATAMGQVRSELCLHRAGYTYTAWGCEVQWTTFVLLDVPGP